MSTLSLAHADPIEQAKLALAAAKQAITAAELIIATPAAPTAASIYYDDDSNPVGSKAQFREFCKRRGLHRFKAGNKTLALRTEVDEAIQAKPLRVYQPRVETLDDDRALLERAGVKLKRTT